MRYARAGDRDPKRTPGPEVEARRWMGPQAGVKWGEDPMRRISRPHVRADSMPTMPARQPAGEPLLRMVRHLSGSRQRSRGASGRYPNGDGPLLVREARTR